MRTARVLFSARGSSGRLNRPKAVQKGDLCMAQPPADASFSDPDKLHLATAVTAKTVVFFEDGSEQEVRVGKVRPATEEDRAAYKERYTKALAQCKAMASADSYEMVESAIRQVREAMGGTLGEGDAIDYLSENVESREGSWAGSDATPGPRQQQQWRRHGAAAGRSRY